MKDSDFRTQASYERSSGISCSMEDYLEMTFRLSAGGSPVRIKDLSSALNVSASSASKMAAAMAAKSLVLFERYGFLTLTDKGGEYGAFLIRRHNTVNRLLCMINNSSGELEETEKIEHFLSERTINNIEKFLSSMS